MAESSLDPVDGRLPSMVSVPIVGLDRFLPPLVLGFSGDLFVEMVLDVS